VVELFWPVVVDVLPLHDHEKSASPKTSTSVSPIIIVSRLERLLDLLDLC
jgi:hypothetical protein